MSRKRFKARSRTFPFAFTHSDALVVVDDLAPGHISESLWFLTVKQIVVVQRGHAWVLF